MNRTCLQFGSDQLTIPGLTAGSIGRNSAFQPVPKQSVQKQKVSDPVLLISLFIRLLVASPEKFFQSLSGRNGQAWSSQTAVLNAAAGGRAGSEDEQVQTLSDSILAEQSALSM